MASRIMGTNHGKSGRNIINDVSGDAVVEATVLFPIMIMIFAALVLLAMYLPSQAVLQRATQHAATAIAAETGDTWLFFDDGGMSYYWETDKNRLKNVYVDLFSGSGDASSKGETIVTEMENRGIGIRTGSLHIESNIVNRILYKEVVVTATREFPAPVDLSFIGFPLTITVTSTSTAVVQNGDEFVRNIDMASDFIGFINEKYGLNNVADAISSFGSRVSGILGW